MSISGSNKVQAIDAQAVLNRSANTLLVDVRSADEFAGKASMGEARLGHIAGAQNFPLQNILQADGTLKPQAEIDEVLNKSFLKKQDDIILYCTSGYRSNIFAQALLASGYTNVKNYTGGFSEWAADESLPIEK